MLAANGQSALIRIQFIVNLRRFTSAHDFLRAQSSLPMDSESLTAAAKKCAKLDSFRVCISASCLNEKQKSHFFSNILGSLPYVRRRGDGALCTAFRSKAVSAARGSPAFRCGSHRKEASSPGAHMMSYRQFSYFGSLALVNQKSLSLCTSASNSFKSSGFLRYEFAIS
jgi:hypothetical protein